ncbi:hypothetical protein PENTCL1PPCAC_20343, partial [Pristionchus entomophagus]
IDPKYTPVSEDAARDYLQSFGYTPGHDNDGDGDGNAEDALNSAIKLVFRKFQDFAGLEQTGLLDEITRLKMASPRCGLPDVEFITDEGGSQKWSKTELTYSIDNWYSSKTRDDILDVIVDAFGIWSEMSPLTFKEVGIGQGDIRIRFGSRSHGDPWPFSIQGGVLAHATFPENGQLHFDSDEHWV